MPELVIHIGYPKCGSTSLQENVFSKIDANYLGRRYKEQDQSDCYRFISGLLLGKQSPGCIPPELQAMVGSDLLSLIAEGSVEPTLSSEKLNIYSDEALLLPYRFEEKNLAPERIKHIFGEESISYNFILIVRNQVDLIESFFAEKFQHLRVFKEINTPKHLWNYSGGGEYRDNFDIQKIVDKYQSEFGSGCVKILLFEDIRKNPDRFYSALSEVLKVNKDQLINLMCRGGVFRQRTLSGSGIRRKKIGIVENLYPRFRLAQTQHGDWSNSGGRRLLLAILRRVNRFGMELEVPGFTVQEKAEVRAYYSQSNENVLGQCYGLDVLKEYGYIS